MTRKYNKQTTKMNFRFIYTYIFVNNLRNLNTNKKTHDDSKVIFHHRKKIKQFMLRVANIRAVHWAELFSKYMKNVLQRTGI